MWLPHGPSRRCGVPRHGPVWGGLSPKREAQRQGSGDAIPSGITWKVCGVPVYYPRLALPLVNAHT